MLKQRTKLDIKGCPACKEESERVLITDNPEDKVAVWGAQWIEDPDSGIIFARQAIRSEIQRKIGLHCLMCERKATNAQNADSQKMVDKKNTKFAKLFQLREHYVRIHKMDLCELCLESKPVLMFEQGIFGYEQLNRHIEK